MRIDQSFPAAEYPRVEVRTQTGEIRVLAGETDSIRVVAEARKESGLQATLRGATVVVSTNRHSWFRSDDAHVTLYVPTATEVIVNTATADIDAATPLSRLVANNASGDIKFDVVSDLEVKTASGDVRGRQVTESCRVVSASGDIRIDSCAGKTEFSSASGDLEIGRYESGVVKVSTASGDVSIPRCQASEVDCKSMSGSLTLGVPPRTRVSLDANTLSGDVHLPSPSGSTESPEAAMAVKVRLVSGDVNLYRNG